MTLLIFLFILPSILILVHNPLLRCTLILVLAALLTRN